MVARELAERLASRGLEVMWAASALGETPADEMVSRLPMQAWNFAERFLGFPYPFWGPISLVRLWKAVRHSDIVHLHDSLYMGNGFASLFARVLRKPVVVTQHVGMIPYSWPVLRGMLALANHVLAYRVLKQCDRCTFISERVQDYFARFVRFRRPPLFIPNGVATALFRPADNDQRQRLRGELGLPINKRIMLFVGRFVEKKGLPILRLLAERFPECEWIFIGWGPDKPTGWGLRNVRCLGSMDHTRIIPYYQAADLLVLPSVGEGFPLVVQEAMACGTPALISKDTAQGMKGFESVAFVSDLAPGSITSTLSEILRSPEHLYALRESVAAFARQQWDWDVCADRYWHLFAELTK
jgi:glycosyltransferase involved in cell wall biosynthesis